MNITVSKEHIIGILQKAGNVTPTRAALAALRAIWLKAEGQTLTCMATDANVDYSGTCAAMVITPGIMGVDSKNFVELVSKMPAGEIRLRKEEDSGNLLVEQGRRKYKLPFVDAKWFVPPRAFPEHAAFLAGDVMHEIIDRVRFCVSSDASTDVLNCLMLRRAGQAVEAMGLNGYNMAVYRVENADMCAMIPDTGMLIAEKYLQYIKKTLPTDEVEMGTCGKFLHFRRAGGDESFSMPLAMHTFPEVDRVLQGAAAPDVPALHVRREELQEALQRTAIFNTKDDKAVKLWLEAEHITLAPNASEEGEASEVMDAVYEGSAFSLAFPALRLCEMLGHFASKDVHMRMQAPEKPCCITGDDDAGYMTVIMPMKVQEEVYYEEDA